MKTSMLRALGAMICLSFFAGTLPAQEPGRIAGTVRNSDTGRVLEGANVTVANANLQAFTDALGNFTLRDVPPGDHIVMFTYAGVDNVYKSVLVPPGAEARADVEMSSRIYKMEAFTVTGEREGNAAAIVRQKTADSIKNVVAMDAMGQLPNDNAGELLIRLPGLAGSVNEDGDVSGLIIRGMGPALNTVSINGSKQGSSAGVQGDYRINALPGAIFDELEVIKASTPDMSADSLGGVVNFKTRSALTMKEKRRFEYRAGARWAPTFLDQIPLREQHSIHPIGNLQYQEVFDAFGGGRNLGVSMTAFYSRNVNGSYWSMQDYEYTLNQPAYIWDYRTRNTLGDRRQSTFSLDVDYKLSAGTKIFVRGFYNDAFEQGQENYIMQAVDPHRGGVPQTAGGVGNYGQDFTEVNPTNSTRVSLESIRYSFLTRERQIQAGAEHTIGHLKMDYDLSYNRNYTNLGNGTGDKEPGGILYMRLTKVGWKIDKSGSEEHPRFTQTAGASIYDPDSYDWFQFTTRNDKRNVDIHGGTVNLKYALPVRAPAMIKTGYRYRKHRVRESKDVSRWIYAYDVNNPFPIDPNYGITMEGAGHLPFYDTAAVRRHLEAGKSDTQTAGKWYQRQTDLDYEADQNYGGTRHASEDTHAGYAMGQVRFGPLAILAGARYEHTKIKGVGWHDRDGDHDYLDDGEITVEPKYGDFFPSAHLTCNITSNFLARVSWSNTIGRPVLANYVPDKTANDTDMTVRINNNDLQPQYSGNWDLSLEYYFEPLGQISIGAFHKSIKDFIVTANMGTVDSGTDNGFNGAYQGYTLLSQFNGQADVKGVEFAWQQQFTFLPGWLKGLGAMANYTHLFTDGDYGSFGAGNPVADVVNFVPKTANAGITYRYGKFNARVMANYTSSYLAEYAAEQYRLFYRDDRTTVNVNLGCTMRPALRFYVDITNIFNEPQRWYRYSRNRLARIIYSGTTVYFGVSGRF
jgi:TonB-dependent receptor